MRLFHMVLTISALSLSAFAAKAESYNYEIRGLGIQLGTVTMTLTQDLAAYSIETRGRLSGLAALFAGGAGTISVDGSFAYDVPTPAIAKAQVNWDDKPRLTVVTFNDGDVTDVTATPPYKFKPGTRAPIDPETLKDVQDPLSAVTRPIVDGKIDCTVRLKIFDGRERYDLQFTPTPDPWTCHAQAINIGGYELKDGAEAPRPLEMTFMPVFDGKYAFPKKLERTMLFGHITVAVMEN